MSNRFHNKFHRNNHHTDPTGGYPDSSYDPIASPAAPFQGTFFSEGDIVTTENLSANESVFADNGTIHENFLIKNNLNVNNVAEIANLDVTGNATIRNNLTVVGNLSALGSVTQLDTVVSVTSALSVQNSGTGPAATITQTGPQDVAVFYDDSNVALIIKDGGNVGINTNSPAQKLTVSGNISASTDAYSNRILLKDGSQASPSLTFQDNTNTGIYSSDQNTVNISTNGSEKLRVYSNGNVALDDFNNLPGAAASPAYKVMHFASPLNNGATMLSMASKSNQTCFFGNLSGGSFVIGNEGSNSSFEFKNNISYASSDTLNTGNSLLTIKGNGNVGIGTTNPNEKLTVSGNISATGTIYDASGRSSDWNSVYSSVANTSANWNSVYSNVQSNSAEWESVYSSVANTSANWNSVYSNVQSGSANWSNMLPTSGGTVTGNITINGTITAPNASSVLSNQVANVGTLDYRYYNAISPQLTERQYLSANGKWVQVAEFPAAGQRHHVEFNAFIFTAKSEFASFKMFFIIDGYDNSGTSPNFFPVCPIAYNYLALSAVRMRTPNNPGPKSMFLDLNFVPSVTSEIGIDSYVKICSRNVTYSQVTPNLSAIVDPVITGHILGPEFLPGNGVLHKTNTGDYFAGREGQTVVNNADNNIKIFAEGAWRQIASW